MECVLSQQTLVLNKAWSAVSMTSVREALKLLFVGAAKAVQHETYEVHGFDSWADLAVVRDEPCIRTVSLSIKVPEVIVLTRYGGMPPRGVAFTRRSLYRRDRNTCQYCGRRPGTSELSIDHVFPRSRGGRSEWTNCVLACLGCNHRKANRTPLEAGLTLRTEPKEPTWKPGFEIPLGHVRQSWGKFVDERYWNVELES